MNTNESVANAFERITQWMVKHGAACLAENLAPGASRERLDAVEAELGFPLGDGLVALWSLHDGQLEEMNGFVESFDLLSTRLAIADKESVVQALSLLRVSSRAQSSSGLTDDELRSNAWLPFALRDSDGLVVNTKSGRVFEMRHDDSPTLRLHAASIVDWAHAYADRVVADDYRVEEGFGDCFLELRDRKKERREEERLRHARAEEARTAAMSFAELIAEAASRNDASAAEKVLLRAEQSARAAFDEAVASLFVDTGTPAFVAAALRTMLKRVTLSSAQWQIVADGGARLGNNAIRDIALAKSQIRDSE